MFIFKEFKKSTNMEEREIIEEIRKELSLGKQYGRSRAVRVYGVTDSKARDLVAVAKSNVVLDDIKPSATKSVSLKKGLSISDLRAKYDNMFIVRNKVGLLEKDLFLTQPEFISMCKLSGTGYRNTIEQPEFVKYKGKAGGIIYWGHPDSIQQLKDEGVLKDF